MLQVCFALGKQRFAADREVRPFGFNRKRRLYALPQNCWIGRIISRSDRLVSVLGTGRTGLPVYVTSPEMVTVTLAKPVRWNVIFRALVRGSLAKAL